MLPGPKRGAPAAQRPATAPARGLPAISLRVAALAVLALLLGAASPLRAVPVQADSEMGDSGLTPVPSTGAWVNRYMIPGELSPPRSCPTLDMSGQRAAARPGAGDPA